MSQTKVSYKRHLAKTITYRIIGTLTTVGLTVGAGLPIKWAAIVGAGELILKPLLYFIHERIWYKWIKFGLIPEKKKKITNTQIEQNYIPTDKKPKPKRLNYSTNR